MLIFNVERGYCFFSIHLFRRSIEVPFKKTDVLKRTEVKTKLVPVPSGLALKALDEEMGNEYQFKGKTQIVLSECLYSQIFGTALQFWIQKATRLYFSTIYLFQVSYSSKCTVYDLILWQFWHWVFNLASWIYYLCFLIQIIRKIVGRIHFPRPDIFFPKTTIVIFHDSSLKSRVKNRTVGNRFKSWTLSIYMQVSKCTLSTEHPYKQIHLKREFHRIHETDESFF